MGKKKKVILVDPKTHYGIFDMKERNPEFTTAEQVTKKAVKMMRKAFGYQD